VRRHRTFKSIKLPRKHSKKNSPAIPRSILPIPDIDFVVVVVVLARNSQQFRLATLRAVTQQRLECSASFATTQSSSHYQESTCHRNQPKEKQRQHAILMLVVALGVDYRKQLTT
jgi:hypothetical protein